METEICMCFSTVSLDGIRNMQHVVLCVIEQRLAIKPGQTIELKHQKSHFSQYKPAVVHAANVLIYYYCSDLC